MMNKPAYFDRVRATAARRWDQLEADPGLAGPWHAMFAQVQSPRHVLSELLQNADDAGATEARVSITDNTFVLEHNGEDFSEEHFAALCEFGRSNKRTLHTIGFWGIGFKSAFSLGDRVELSTPTLSVAFERIRFTEPMWTGGPSPTSDLTRVTVAFGDPERSRQVHLNLDEWCKNPASLLFFNSIRCLYVGGMPLRWRSDGPGPVAGSEWVLLSRSTETERYLIVRSAPMAFPHEVLMDICRVRRLAEGTELPPASVEIVLGVPGRLFVVLPTSVKTTLPFAINAPFLQDPARHAIGEPSNSPTNKWLLERAGRLAADTMCTWLGNSALSQAERAKAYGLLPPRNVEENSLGGSVTQIVTSAFAAALHRCPAALTEDGGLEDKHLCVVVPEALGRVWPLSEAVQVFSGRGKAALSPFVASAHIEGLVLWGIVSEVTDEQVLHALQHGRIPHPGDWERILALWRYVAAVRRKLQRSFIDLRTFQLLPIRGDDCLRPATGAVRLAATGAFHSSRAWQIVFNNVRLIDPEWLDYVDHLQGRTAEVRGNAMSTAADDAYAIMRWMYVDRATDINVIFARVVESLANKPGNSRADLVLLAQLAAHHMVAVSARFPYVTVGGGQREAAARLIGVGASECDALIPPSEREDAILHPAYAGPFEACTRDEWQDWLASGSSMLQGFVSPEEVYCDFSGRDEIIGEARRRGVEGNLEIVHGKENFEIGDWDFPESYWVHWQRVAAADDGFWVRVASVLLRQPWAYWQRVESAAIYQVPNRTRRKAITKEKALPAWIMKLRGLPCLRDTRGRACLPSDLLRRTPTTEGLLDVEPFIDARDDSESQRPKLSMLGVGSEAHSPARILDRLRALAAADTPLIHEVEKYYLRLDKMATTGSSASLQAIRDAFAAERLVLADDGQWTTASGVFVFGSDDVPGAAVVREQVRDLALWGRVGVRERPTIDMVLEWLSTLPTGHKVPEGDFRRVQAILSRHPGTIWAACGHWLNLAGEWAPVRTLAWSMGMQTLVAYRNLGPWVLQRTADVRGLGQDASQLPPFCDLQPLSRCIEEQFIGRLPAIDPGSQPWLLAIAAELQRAKLEKPEETDRIREIANRLFDTAWYNVPFVDVVPFIDGTPAGQPQRVEAAWIGDTLLVGNLKPGRAARCIVDAVAKVFGRDDIRQALSYAFERAPRDIAVYMNSNFEIEEIATSQSIPQREAVDASPSIAEAVQRYDSPEASDRTPVDEIDSVVEVLGEVPQDEELEIAIDDGEGREDAAPRARATPMIERFAVSRGFMKEGGNSFIHPSGRVLSRAESPKYLWELHGIDGTVAQIYWVKDHCLLEKPLDVPAEFWGMITCEPDRYTLVLVDGEGQPAEISGTALMRLKDSGVLQLFPSAYRLIAGGGGRRGGWQV